MSYSLGTQLPICADQCTKLSHALDECYSDIDTLMNSHLMSESLSTELLLLIAELNCTRPDGFLVPLMPVDQEDCVSLDVYCEFREFCFCFLLVLTTSDQE